MPMIGFPAVRLPLVVSVMGLEYLCSTICSSQVDLGLRQSHFRISLGVFLSSYNERLLEKNSMKG